MQAPLFADDVSGFFGDAHRRLAERLQKLTLQDSWSSLAATGLFEYLVPPAGKPADVRSLCLIRDALGYRSPLCDGLFAVHGLGGFPLFLAKHPAWPKLYPDYVKGKVVFAFALTEPEAGSDVGSMKTTASPDFVLNGEKTLISNVGIATHYVVFANANPAAGKKGISAFLVPAETKGLVGEHIELAYDHPIGRLRFNDCKVGKDALIGEIGDGFRLAMQTLDAFRVGVGAAAVGMGRRALAEAIKHVGAREQFGKPLADQPVVQSMLADMATELEAARLLVIRAAYAHDQGLPDPGRAAAMAKLYATEAAFRIIDQAVQLKGGMGVKRGEVVETLTRAIRPMRIYEGTSEIQRLIIGRGLTREGA
jgi:acyl-CoA dehydrogenase